MSSEGNKNINVTLADLSERAMPIPEGVAMSTAVIAEAGPRELRQALFRTWLDGTKAVTEVDNARRELGGAATLADMANDSYRRIVPSLQGLEHQRKANQPKADEIRLMLPPDMQADFMKPESTLLQHIKGWMKRSEEAGIRLASAELQVTAAKKAYDNVRPNLELRKQIISERRRLGLPVRVGLFLSSIALVGGGIGIGIAESSPQSSQQAVAERPSVKTEISEDVVIALIVGAGIDKYAGQRLGIRVARSRARKIIAKAQ